MKLLLGIVSDYVRAIGDLCCQPEFGGKVGGDDSFCDLWEGLVSVSNDGSNHILEVDLVVMFVKLAIVVVGVGLT